MPTCLPSKRSYLTLFLVLATAALLAVASTVAPTVRAQEGSVPEVDSSGDIIGAEAAADKSRPAPGAPTDVEVMCFSQKGVCTRVEALFPNSVTTYSSLAAFPGDLSPYDVVYVGNDEGDALENKATQLQNYVSGGGGLVVAQPNLEGDVTIFPPGFEMYVEDRFYDSDTAALLEFTPVGQEHPILDGVTPQEVSPNFETVPLDRAGPGWTVLVKEQQHPWLSLAVGQYGSGRLAFHTGNINTSESRRGSDSYVSQLIEWSAGANAGTGPDVQIDAIEVTQAIQDLDNSVTLVAGKRTYVRVHVSAPNYVPDVYANLSATMDGERLFPTLAPGNPGADINIWYDSGDRSQIDDSFWFELPTSWTGAGELTLTARIDPALGLNDADYGNNTDSVTVTFVQTPPLQLSLFNVRYTMNGTTYLADNLHLNALESWLERAYPIPELQSTRQTFTYPEDGLPNVDRLHGYLALGKLLNIIFDDEDTDVHYYGMVDDGGDFMRGKALDIPSTIAAGPSGTPRFNYFEWDGDNSYGDWYGGHELAHTLGRYHAEYCGAVQGRPYPYNGGDISPDSNGSDELYGFDVANRNIYDPQWHDVMTYCNDQWISDFTYEGIHDHLVGATRAPQVVASQFVAVVASVDLAQHSGSIDDLYLVQEEGSAPLPESGKWLLVLLDGNGNELASSYGVAAHELTDGEESAGRPGFITAVVPAVDGLAEVEIRYDGVLVDARQMSAHPPTVTITAPQDGAEFGSGPITFSWQGDDLDDDDLTYSVFYSHEQGSSWQPLATGLTKTSLTIPSELLPGGTARLKVVVNDGMRSASDTTGDFYPLGHAPEVTIVSPQEGATFWQSQLVTLRADVDDLEEGTLSGSSVVWSTDEGVLGTGTTLSTVNLSTGTHTITVAATDSSNRTGQAQVTIEVVPADAPESDGSFQGYLPLITR